MSGNLKAFLPANPLGDMYKLEDVKDIPLTILGYTDSMGEFGAIVFMDCLTPAGEKVKVMAGATLIIEALHAATAANAFPVDATFKKPGKAWICA
jgi:hypothetical protein